MSRLFLVLVALFDSFSVHFVFEQVRPSTRVLFCSVIKGIICTYILNVIFLLKSKIMFFLEGNSLIPLRWVDQQLGAHNCRKLGIQVGALFYIPKGTKGVISLIVIRPKQNNKQCNIFENQ